jgi:hypothetical protein
MKTVIIGPPRTGKSTLARKLARPTDIYCSDHFSHTKEPIQGVNYLPERITILNSGKYVAMRWLSLPDPWVIEGHAAARALRHWLSFNVTIPCDRIYVLTRPKVETTDGQRKMGKGILTVWSHLYPHLSHITHFLDND